MQQPASTSAFAMIRAIALAWGVLVALAACSSSDDELAGTDSGDELPTDTGGGDEPAPVPATKVCNPYDGPSLQALHHYRGTLHAHTKYSDGDAHSIPADVFSAGFNNGLDFASSSDHSDTLNNLLFISVGSTCFESITGLLSCLLPEHGDLNRWTATRQQAEADTTESFLAIRGFEWTNDRVGHINVYFSSNFANAKLDPAYLTGQAADNFYDWLRFDPAPEAVAGVTPVGGGGDGLAVFNHPGDKCFSTDDAACNWNQFEYVAKADQQMVGMELYNGGRDDSFPDYYMQALDHGWHVGAAGAEDRHDTGWSLPQYPKTVVLAETLDAAGFRQAMLARRMYAVVSNQSGENLMIEMDVEGHPMGSRLQCDAGATVPLTVKLSLPSGQPFSGVLRLYDHANPDLPFAGGGYGDPVATAFGDTLNHELPVAGDGEHWFFVRVDNGADQSLAYTSPVWISPR